jgi:hypothetical protein
LGAVTVKVMDLLPLPPETTQTFTVRVPDLLGVRLRESVVTVLAGMVRFF